MGPINTKLPSVHTFSFFFFAEFESTAWTFESAEEKWRRIGFEYSSISQIAENLFSFFFFFFFISKLSTLELLLGNDLHEERYCSAELFEKPTKLQRNTYDVKTFCSVRRAIIRKTAELHTVAELTDTQGAALTVETLSFVAVAPPPFPLVEQSHRLPSLRTGDHYTQEQEVLSPSTLIAAWLQSQNMQFNENHSNKKGQQAEGLGAS